MKKLFVVAVITAALSIAGCAFDLVRIKPVPAALLTDDLDRFDTLTLRANVEVTSTPCGYNRELRGGTRWVPEGRIGAGIVYQSPDQLVTFECSNVFEVYIVVNDGQFVGGYLPVEKSYVPLKKPVQLDLY